MDKYKNKYRSESARATWWNYGWAGAYFITICTKDRKHYFGDIVVETRHALSLQQQDSESQQPQKSNTM